MGRRKKGGGHGGHHGGSWKVAYADFVTSMFALFLVLWLIGLTPQEKREDLARYFKDPNLFQGSGQLPGRDKPIDTVISIIPAQSAGAPDQLAMMQQASPPETIVSQLQDSLEEGSLWAFRDRVKVTQTTEGVEVSIIEKANEVMFDSGSARPNPKTLDILKAIARELKTHGNHLMIGGHTDAHPLVNKPGYTNWELSADRANKVRSILEGGGVDSRRVSAVRGFADTRPINTKNPFAAQNRRISVVVLKR